MVVKETGICNFLVYLDELSGGKAQLTAKQRII